MLETRPQQDQAFKSLTVNDISLGEKIVKPAQQY